MTFADSVETLGVDLRTKVKKLGAKEKARRKKCYVWFSLIKKNEACQKNFMKVGVNKLLRAGMMPARTWGGHVEGMSPAERFKLRRQMAAAAGKKSTTSLSWKHTASKWKKSTMATQNWAEGVWTGKWRSPAGAVMYETRDRQKMATLAHIDLQQ